jgi:hypothetical protein
MPTLPRNLISKFPKSSLYTAPWNIEASNDLKRQIITNPQLISELNEVIKVNFEEHGVDLTSRSYIFEPKVFEIDNYASNGELDIKDAVTLFQKLYQFHPEKLNTAIQEIPGIRFPFPEVGPLDPDFLNILKKYRLIDSLKQTVKIVSSAPYLDSTTLNFMQNILDNEKLLDGISNGIAKTLKDHGVKLGDNQSYVFVPYVFETPVYAQVIDEIEAGKLSNVFNPTNLTSTQFEANTVSAGFVRVMDHPAIKLFPAAVIKDFMIAGIPAPELLKGLDAIKNF